MGDLVSAYLSMMNGLVGLIEGLLVAAVVVCALVCLAAYVVGATHAGPDHY